MDSPGQRVDQLNEQYKAAQAAGDTAAELAIKAQIAVAYDYLAGSESFTPEADAFTDPSFTKHIVVTPVVGHNIQEDTRIDVASAIDSGREDYLRRLGMPESTIGEYKTAKANADWLRTHEQEELARQQEETTATGFEPQPPESPTENKQEQKAKQAYIKSFGTTSSMASEKITPLKPITLSEIPSIKTSSGKLKGLGSLAGVGLIVTATPVPFDDLAFWLVAAGVTAYTSYKGGEILNTTKQAYAEYKSQTGHNPTAGEIVVVDKSGNMTTLADAVIQKQNQTPTFATGITAPTKEGFNTGIEGPKLGGFRTGYEAPRLGGFTTGIERPKMGVETSPELPSINTGLVNVKEPMVLLPGTKTLIPERLLGKGKSVYESRNGIIVSSANLARQVKELPLTRKQSETLTEALRQMNQERIRRAFADINRAIQTEQQREAFRRFIQTYNYHQRQMARYKEATKAYEIMRDEYASSLDLRPANGRMTEAMAKAYADLMVLRELHRKAAISAAAKSKQQSETQVEPQMWVRPTLAEQAAERSQTQIQTQTQSRAQQATRTRAQTKTKAQEATKTQEATRTREATRTAEQEATREGETTQEAEMENVAELTKTRLRLSGGIKPKSDEEKRQIIAGARGASAWPQGELNGKKVWHTVLEPYNEAHHLIVVGEAPEGATVYPGPREAYRNIIQLAGKPPTRPSRLEGGAVDPILSSSNGRVRINFVKDIGVRRHRPRVRVVPSETIPGAEEIYSGGHRKRHLRLR